LSLGSAPLIACGVADVDRDPMRGAVETSERGRVLRCFDPAVLTLAIVRHGSGPTRARGGKREGRAFPKDIEDAAHSS
jgi:hypothetical protein